MNPFTRFLKQWSSNQPLEEFITHWDALEHVMVNVYRKKMLLEEAQPFFDASWPWLRQNYKNWMIDLRPYWQKTKAAGELTKTDPFQMLIDLPTVSAILDNWSAMQHLPAAREALNQYLLENSRR